MAIVLPAGPAKPAEPATSNGNAAEEEAVYAAYRPLLFSIAYHITGSAAEAEDIVQDAFRRYHTTPGLQIRSPRAFLSTIVTRLSLDRLKSARRAREHYVGSWLPEPVLTASTGLSDGSARPRFGVEPAAEPLETVEQRESISLAFLLLLESLTLEERAVFVLHEAFDYPYDEIAGILGKTPAACRQLLHRASAHCRAPPFNRHYTGDLGTLTLALGVGLLGAARNPARHRALIATAALGNLLHTLNHLYDDVWLGGTPLSHVLGDAGPLALGTLLLIIVALPRRRKLRQTA